MQIDNYSKVRKKVMCWRKNNNVLSYHLKWADHHHVRKNPPTAIGPSWMAKHEKVTSNHDWELQQKKFKKSPWHDNNVEIVLSCVGVGYGAYLHFGMHTQHNRRNKGVTGVAAVRTVCLPSLLTLCQDCRDAGCPGWTAPLSKWF